MLEFNKNLRSYINKPSPIYQVLGELPNEEFRIITDREVPGIAPYYTISNYGRIWLIYKNKFLKPGRDGGGYVCCILRSVDGRELHLRIHRLIMLVFRYDEYEALSKLYPDESIVVNHINDVKHDNYINDPTRPDNLEWTTQSENVIKAMETGAKLPGTSLTAQEVEEICKLLLRGVPYNDIATRFNISYGTVASIKFNKTWKPITSKYFGDN